MNETQPQGKSMKELHRLVEEDQTRFADLAQTWTELTVDEQCELVLIARSMLNRD